MKTLSSIAKLPFLNFDNHHHIFIIIYTLSLGIRFASVSFPLSSQVDFSYNKCRGYRCDCSANYDLESSIPNESEKRYKCVSKCENWILPWQQFYEIHNTYSIPFLACSNRRINRLFVAVVKNIGPTADSCSFKSFPSNSIWPMAVIILPSRNISSVVCIPLWRIPEKNPNTLSKNDNDTGS